MIIPENAEQYDNSVKFLVFETDKNGNAIQVSDAPPIAGKEELGQVLYQTRFDELLALKEQIVKGEISPIKLYMINQMLDEKDVARRTGISLGRVKKTLAMEGFKKTTIGELLKYAKVFGVSVSDFFIIINTNKNAPITLLDYFDKLIREINLQ